MRTHPHADATYRVIPGSAGAFVVEIIIPDTYPTVVSGFASAQAAEAWVDGNKKRVAAEGLAGRWFQKPGKGGFRRW